MSVPLADHVVKVTIKNFGTHCKLIILGKRPGVTRPTLFYGARCANLADAAEQLKNWLNGVIIV